jgi:signal peptidase II
MAEASAAASGAGSPFSANRAFYFGVALSVFAADQAVKWAVKTILLLPERLTVPWLPFFQLNWAPNRGVSMSYLWADGDAQRWLLVGLTAAVAIFVLAWLWRERRREDAVGLALILGGALGNILDRMRLGYVVDYADLHFGAWRPFFVFNLGDAAITIGVLLLLVRALLTRERKAPREKV